MDKVAGAASTASRGTRSAFVKSEPCKFGGKCKYAHLPGKVVDNMSEGMPFSQLCSSTPELLEHTSQ